MNISPHVAPYLLGMALCVASCSGNADAIDQDEVLELRRAGHVAPFQQILRAVFERYPNVQILEVELEEDAGKYAYELEVLIDDGTVRELEIDAHSGEILEDELED